MKREFQAMALSVLMASCAASEEAQTAKPSIVAPTPTADEPQNPPHVEPPHEVPETGGTPTAANAVTPSIASARLVQDCPDPKPAAAIRSDEPAPARGARAKRSRRQGGGSFKQPCTQSSVQLAFSKSGETRLKVELKEIRLLSADDKMLGTLSARMPTHWQEGTYVAWDGMLMPNAENKASYKLSLPDWSAVESASGKSSYETMYILEVDVDVAGTITTVRSPQFERSRPQIIRT